MSVLPLMRTIINKLVSDVSQLSNNIRGSIKESSRAFSKEFQIDITNPHQEDQIIQFEKNPFEKKKQECILCRLKINPDYKNIRLLSQFQSRYTGRIYGRHITGLCKKKQKAVETQIRRAQNCGLMPFMIKQIDYVNDPKLFDPDHPFRPHKYD